MYKSHLNYPTSSNDKNSICDPTVDGVWSYCFNETCTVLPKEGELCNVSLVNNFPCANPWLTCVNGTFDYSHKNMYLVFPHRRMCVSFQRTFEWRLRWTNSMPTTIHL